MVHVEAQGRRARHREERRRDILETAMRLVSDEGLEACTTHRIAKELDVAVGGLYRYFPSKAALLGELERVVIDDTAAELKRAWARAEAERRWDDPAAAALAPLVVAARAYAAQARREPSRFGLISLIMADPRVLVPGAEGGAVMGAMVGLLALVAQRFDAAARAGALAPGPGLARGLLFWSSVRGVLQMLKLEPRDGRLSVSALLDEMLRTLLVGWGASSKVAAEVVAQIPDQGGEES